MIISCQGDQYSHIDNLNVKICSLFQILKTEQDVERSLVQILATRESVVPLANNTFIMSGRSIQLLGHLKFKNCQLFQILWTEKGRGNNSGGRNRGTERSTVLLDHT